MTRPERKLKSLKDKIEQKTSRPKAGKRVKRWKKWAEKYQSLVG